MDNSNDEKNSSFDDKKNKEIRNIDILTQDVQSFWGKTFVFIQKTRIKTWQGVFILAFVAGAAMALVLSVSIDIQSKTDALEGANLTLFTDDTAVTLENGSNLVNMDVLLNTHSNDVTVVTAVVNYNPQNFELQSWSTDNSIFADGNDCIYNGKPCEIVNNDTSNGKITITVAKPTPGVDTSSGIVAQLVFKALQVTHPSSPNITLGYTFGHADDSDAISDDVDGTDILSSVVNAQVDVYTAICSSFVYSTWDTCQPDGTQTRTVTSSIPSGCYGGSPVLEQDCDYTSGPTECTNVVYSEWGACQPDSTQSRTVVSKEPADCSSEGLQLTQGCTYNPPACTDITYSAWGACQPNSKQTRTVAQQSPDGCSAGTLVLEQSCAYTAPTCSSFDYSAWGDCQPDSTQSRTIDSSSPAGCTGGSPVTQQSCTYQGGSTTCTSFTYSSWTDCQSNNTQSRTVASSSPDNCTGGNPSLERSCTYTAQSCTDFTYSDWGACQADSTQSRTTSSSSPAGCSGGNPVIVQSCQYANAAQADTSNDSSSSDSSEKKDEKSKDKQAPKFTDLPLFLNKHRGDMIWWKAKDNKGIDHYRYSFNGQTVKTKTAHFSIGNNVSKGLHILTVKAYDKAGNSKRKIVTIMVR